MPENYEKLLKEKAYLEFALKRYEEKEKELRRMSTFQVHDRINNNKGG